MARVGRIVAVTLGLSIAGALFGALAGVLAFVLLLTLNPSQEVFWLPTLQVFAIPAIVGACLGALGAPAIAWLLLRYVPLGKAIAWSTVGTVIGGVAGWAVGVALYDAIPDGIDTALGYEVKGAVLGGLVGFLAAAVILRLRTSAARASPIELEGPAA